MRGRAQGAVAEVRRFVRANLSAGIASGIEWLVVTGLVLAGAHYLAAAAIGAATGAVVDFSLERVWAFERLRRAGVGREGLRYLGVSAASLALNVAGAFGLVDGLGMPKVPGVIAASILVGLVWNYPLHRLWVFRPAAAPPPREPGERRDCRSARL